MVFKVDKWQPQRFVSSSSADVELAHKLSPAPLRTVRALAAHWEVHDMPHASRRGKIQRRHGSDHERGLLRDARLTDEEIVGSRITVRPDGCWAYNGDITDYRRTRTRSGVFSIHRFVYETLVGPIPDDHHLHHECENPGCCNPAHLVPLTPGDHRRRHAEMQRSA